MLTKIHHIGIACQDIMQAIEDFKMYHNVMWQSDIVEDTLQNAQLCLLRTDMGLDYEFVSGPQVERMVKKGTTYYHLCYEVNSIDESIKYLLTKGAIMVSEPKPAILFDNKRVAFLYLSYGLVELVENNKT
ncbi:MAG: VOC family protein [Proteiniphilum sp.]|nr:VOC family protein [Proteiniphilum sp.]